MTRFSRQAPKTYPDDVLRRVQEMELAMLRAVDDICRREGLVYFADGGTCLGAVRHGGFIPWDDDVDLGMPIDDYRTFLRIAPEALPEGMSVHVMENTKGFSFLWTKIFMDGTRFLDRGAVQAKCPQGVFLDVFPYIPLDAPERVATRCLNVTQSWQKVSYLRHMSSANIPVGVPWRVPKVATCVMAHALLWPTTTDALVRRRFERAFPADGSGAYWANPCAPRPYPYLRDVLFPVVEKDFCDMPIFVPHRADAYLTQLYGDYRKVPPPEKRHTHAPLVLDFGDGINVMEA